MMREASARILWKAVVNIVIVYQLIAVYEEHRTWDLKIRSSSLRYFIALKYLRN
jgi:hypothetical protein